MHFLANENFPGAAVAALEATGHDVVWIRTAAPGIADRASCPPASQRRKFPENTGNRKTPCYLLILPFSGVVFCRDFITLHINSLITEKQGICDAETGNYASSERSNAVRHGLTRI
jgi:hypothetical protein